MSAHRHYHCKHWSVGKTCQDQKDCTNVNWRETSRHCLAPRSLPPCTKNPFHTLIHEHQYQNMPKEKLPSNWDLPRSSHAGKEDFKEEEWGKNRKSWNLQPNMIMSRIEQNSELIRTLTFKIEDLR